MNKVENRVLSLMMAGVLCLSGLGLTGCGQEGDADKKEAISTMAETATETGDSQGTESESASGVDQSEEGSTESGQSEASSMAGSPEDMEPVTQDLWAMDTYMTISVWGQEADQAVSAAIDEINRIDAMVSTGSENSEITKLNHKGKGQVSEGTGYMIERSLELFESTGGLYDISIYPVMRLWGFTDQKYKVPEDNELKELLSHVDAGAVNYNRKKQSVSFSDSVTEIDLGGIAKGYTADRVIEVIDSFDVACALINLGGNVKTLNKKVTGEDWRIAVQSPLDASKMCGVVTCSDKAVITSGGYQRFFEENGISYHHIIDPRTGYPAKNGLLSVSIVSADGTLADGLSTSLFIMGLEDAHSYWQQHKDEFDAVLVDDEGKIYITAGLKDSFWAEEDWKVLE